ncbi:purple acid phosphatase 17-like isoform X2 [Argentina anserina]|uniref:purple acid phosphatase 17-like isoform X2 n=1 Tax=Argentina anserina TaxID=57926 RepID=UPI0021763BC6|nr:purple acid phosphatase 17-like isoform X2 [Potentilla anserina]
MILNIPCKKSRSLCFFLVLLSSVICIVTTSAELQRFEHPTKEDGSLSFLVLGDWGRRGEFNQSEVAFQMGKVGEKLDIDFVISTGDNFYDNGLSSEHDTAFEESFTKIYTQRSLQKQWYSILGNHDYRGDAEAQLSPLLRKIDRRWLCLRSFVVNAELAEILFVDTTPFVNMYFTSTEDHSYDWRGIPSRKAYIQTLLKDVELVLKKSSARWKIVVGHHAIRSIGHHGDTQELIKHLLPILQANDVDFYMNGHDHCLEHISDIKSGIQFLTSGAGSKAWRGDMKNEEGLNKQGQLVNFFYDGQGFMSVKLNLTQAEIAFFDVFGNVIHSWTTSKLLHPSI